MRRRLPTIDLTEASAAVADLGVLAPIVAALVLVNGLDAGAAMAFAGALFVAAGLFYRVPVPVQPIKAAAAIAIATHASPSVIAAAGVCLGAVLLVLAATKLIVPVARLFPTTIIRGNQLGLGILLVVAAHGMTGGGEDRAALVVATAIAATLVVAGRARGVAAVAFVAGGVAWSLWHGGAFVGSIDPHLPAFAMPAWSDLATAMTLLVVPQIPLTLGNAIVGTAAIEREYYGARAARVTPVSLSVSCGLANVGLGLFGGMPLCHGSSGATAYYRYGARTGGVNLVIGGALLAAGVLFAPSAVRAFELIPPAVLAGLLAYAGVRHAMLAADRRGAHLVVAVAMGVTGGVTQNLMIGMAVGLPAYAFLAGARRARAALGGAR